MLASPDSGLFGQGARFALTGGLVAGVYLGTTTVLADVAGLPFQAALISGFCVALMVHFTLQRNFVWGHDDEFALPLRHQAGRYLVIACVQYGVTALHTRVAADPGALRRSSTWRPPRSWWLPTSSSSDTASSTRRRLPLIE
jgi:hypothetical protein